MKQSKSISFLSIFLVLLGFYVSATSLAYGESHGVQVETIKTNKPDNGTVVKEAWDQTKQKTGAAAGAVADYTTTQGSKALKATKSGAAKGADVVVTQSKKAWSATKSGTAKAVDYTVEKSQQAGKAIVETFSDSTKTAPVSERSVNVSE